MGGQNGQNLRLFRRLFNMDNKIKWLRRNKMNSCGSSRIGRGALIVALKYLGICKNMYYVSYFNLTKVTRYLLLCAPHVLDPSASMYLPSYAIDKSRFSSSWNTTYCKMYYDVSPIVKSAWYVFFNSGNSIFLHVILKLFSVDHLPASKPSHV